MTFLLGECVNMQSNSPVIFEYIVISGLCITGIGNPAASTGYNLQIFCALSAMFI